MVVVVGYGVASAIATILQCGPISRAWDKTVTGTCFTLTAFWYANASYAIVTDLILLVLPMRVIWRLQLGIAQKIAVLMVFALGGVVTVCSIIRMTTLATSSTSADPTCRSTCILQIIVWLTFPPSVDDVSSTKWANIEENIAVLCACLPVFRRPLAILFPRLFSSLGHTSMPASQVERGTFAQAETDRISWIGDSKRTNNALLQGRTGTSMTGTSSQDCDRIDFNSSYVQHVEDIRSDTR